MSNGYDPLAIPQCIPAPIRRAVQQADQALQKAYNLISDQGDEIVNLQGPPGPDYLNNQPASYYLNQENHTGFPPNTSFQVRRIELTGALSSGSSNAKFLEWNGSAYVVSGSDFTVYDAWDAWAHALTGDQGFIAYDTVRDVWLVQWLDSPFHRDVTLTGALTSGGSTTGTDVTSTSQTMTVYGQYVRSGRKIPTSAKVGVAWFGKPKKWYAISSDTCDVAA
jgi:hypothetical protein